MMAVFWDVILAQFSEVPAASFSYHDDEGSEILWKISTLLPAYKVLEPRRQLSSFTSIFRILRTDHKNEIYCRHSNTFSLFAPP
jgi:hypothetical protein